MKEKAKTKSTATQPPAPEVVSFPMRINKYLAWKKHSTRRGADDLIKDKKVFLNGKLAVLGDKVNEKDTVEVRFRGPKPSYIYIAYNKPVGVVTHSAQEGEVDILEKIKKNLGNDISSRGVFPIGRIDKESHGLILLTNDGRITERLLSPKFFHEKEYLVKTKEPLRSSFKEKMERGVQIDEEKTAPCKVTIVNDNTFKIILTEGKRHQIRRMCVALFQEVLDLKRIRIMNIELAKLPDGAHREIKGKELEVLLKSLELA